MTPRMDASVGAAVCAKLALAPRSETINRVSTRAMGNPPWSYQIAFRSCQADRKVAGRERLPSYGARLRFRASETSCGPVHTYMLSASDLPNGERHAHQ